MPRGAARCETHNEDDEFLGKSQFRQRRLERESIALSEGRRVESHWVMTSVFDKEDTLVAGCLLNKATVKESYVRYPEEAASLAWEKGADTAP